MPDFERGKPPDFVPEPGATGPAALGGADPFIMQRDGKAALFVATGLADGPLPTHYEPAESPLAQRGLQTGRQPGRQVVPGPRGDHDQLGGMTRSTRSW